MHFGSRRWPRICFVPLLTLFVAGSVGCRRESGQASVQGHVSYRGEAVAPGAITFFPATGRPVTATISEQGDYTAELTPGEYTVIVNLAFIRPPGFKEGDPMPKPKFTLPEQYTTRAMSKLKANIKPGQDHPIDFALE
jgi:hypothetical protein